MKYFATSSLTPQLYHIACFANHCKSNDKLGIFAGILAAG